MTLQNNNTVERINRNKKLQKAKALSMRAAREAHNDVAVRLINLDPSKVGLTEASAATRLEKEGCNEVAHDKPPHALIQLVKAFNNPFICILGVLAGISFFTDYWLPFGSGEAGDLTTVGIIGAMVSLSGLVRFRQEHRSTQAVVVATGSRTYFGSLAKGTLSMTKRKVVVKRLNAIQNLGAMDVLCTDKTGTLTQDKIILEHHIDTYGHKNESVLGLAWLNSHHQSGIKNLMDQAVVYFAENEPDLVKQQGGACLCNIMISPIPLVRFH